MCWSNRVSVACSTVLLEALLLSAVLNRSKRCPQQRSDTVDNSSEGGGMVSSTE